MGVLAFFPTGTYAGIGTMCVEPEIYYEKYHEKKKFAKMPIRTKEIAVSRCRL